MKQLLIGANLFFTPGYAFSTVILAVVMIVRYIGSRDKKFQTLYLLAAFLFELSPFLLTIYVGTAPPIRSQLVIPFVIAGNFLLLLELRPKGLYRFFAIAALIFGAHTSRWLQRRNNRDILF